MAPTTLPPTSRGLTLHVTIFIAPENVEKFLGHMYPVYKLVAAEPECTFFEVYYSASEPGVVHWVESWTKDQAWLLEVQLQKEYYKPYFEATEPLFIKPREFKLLERLSPEWTTIKPEHTA